MKFGEFAENQGKAVFSDFPACKFYTIFGEISKLRTECPDCAVWHTVSLIPALCYQNFMRYSDFIVS